MRRAYAESSPLVEGILPAEAAERLGRCQEQYEEHRRKQKAFDMGARLKLVYRCILVALPEENHRVSCEELVELQDCHVDESTSCLVAKELENQGSRERPRGGGPGDLEGGAAANCRQHPGDHQAGTSKMAGDVEDGDLDALGAVTRTQEEVRGRLSFTEMELGRFGHTCAILASDQLKRDVAACAGAMPRTAP